MTLPVVPSIVSGSIIDVISSICSHRERMKELEIQIHSINKQSKVMKHTVDQAVNVAMKELEDRRQVCNGLMLQFKETIFVDLAERDGVKDSLKQVQKRILSDINLAEKELLIRFYKDLLQHKEQLIDKDNCKFISFVEELTKRIFEPSNTISCAVSGNILT